MEKTSTFHDKIRFKQYLSTNSALKKVIDRKLQSRRLVVSTKTQAIDNIIPESPKEEHTHTLPPLTTKPNKISGINNHWSLTSLTINRFNLPIKRHRLMEWIQK